MNRRNIINVLLLALSAIGAQAQGIVIKGSTQDKDLRKVYMFKVVDEQYGYYAQLDSIDIKDGQFTYSNDTLRTQLLMLSPVFDLQGGRTVEQGTTHFFVNGENRVVLSRDATGKLMASLQDNQLEQAYLEYTAEKYRIGDRRRIDSLDNAFYAARDKGDKAEMARIKEETGPYYDAAAERLKTWRRQQMQQYDKTPFGTLLFYNSFIRLSPKSIDEINRIRKRLESFSEEAKQTAYYTSMIAQLEVMQKSVSGQQAPPINGVDMQGKKLNLDAFKGKYVLVDFWSSGCSWCRKETPNLLKTYNTFKDRNFTILGVSTDLDKAAWLRAISHDKAIWNHLILPRSTRDSTLSAYAIVGIPEILLIDPHGNIIAKGLRGAEIYKTVGAALSK